MRTTVPELTALGDLRVARNAWYADPRPEPATEERLLVAIDAVLAIAFPEGDNSLDDTQPLPVESLDERWPVRGGGPLTVLEDGVRSPVEFELVEDAGRP